jgi:hypothetical protein
MASNISHDQPADPSGRRPINLSRSRETNPGISASQMAYREALVLWLRWNHAYEHVTVSMFESKSDPKQLEELMDQMERLRQEAIELSQKLLD